MSLNLTAFGRQIVTVAMAVCFIYAAAGATASPQDIVFTEQRSSTESESALPCLTGLCNMGVWTLCEYNGDLYAGGQFTSADGQPTPFIARWDGSRWHDVGGGMNHYVYDFAVYDNQLIAGGVFDTVGGVPMNHIAVWDGISWAPLGEGVNRRPGIKEMCVYEGDLIVCGGFDSAGSVASPNLAKWNGTSWEAFGPGGGIGFSAMTIYQGDLILNNAPGGGFSRWDGSTWTTINHPIFGGVHCLGVFDGKLIAGGFFATAGGDTVNNIVAWDGISWLPLGNGVDAAYWTGSNPNVLSLYVYNGDLIVGGNFTSAGTDSAYFIARWDGVAWHPIGGGIGGPFDDHQEDWVTSITEYNGDLIAGGLFAEAGGLIANRIAGWNGSDWYPLTANEGFPYTVEVDIHRWLPAETEVSGPVRKISGSDPMYGFDLLISYDDRYVNFVDARPGPIFDIPGEYEWEYFSSRADSGLIRIVGLAETNDGAHHPVSGEIPDGLSLFTLDFVTADMSPGEIAETDISFFWQDCGDNSILTDSLGYDLALSDSVYDPHGVNITDHSAPFPSGYGAPDECVDGGLIRDIDFYSGYINLIDTTTIDFRGDINVNGIGYEIADWVMLLNFFLTGPEAFGFHMEGSIEASDVNADGIVLGVADLYYLWRIICGDFNPNPVKSSIDTLRFVQDVATRTVSIEYPDTLGAVACVFEGDITPTFLVDTSVYECVFKYDGRNTSVVIHPPQGQDSCGIGLHPGALFTYTGQGYLVRGVESLRITGGATSDGQEISLTVDIDVTGDQEGNLYLFDPDPVPRALERISDSEMLTFYTRDFTGHDIYDVDLASVRINDSIVPLSVATVSSMPVLQLPALEIVVSARDFIGSYALQPDTGIWFNYFGPINPPYMNWDYVASITGSFGDALTFTAFRQIRISNTAALIPVPGGWPAIGDAVSLALSGDTIEISAGTYAGDSNRDLIVDNKSLHIRSISGPDSTIIDCGGAPGDPHYAFLYSDTGDAAEGLLKGFTIRNAYTDTSGAVYIRSADIAIQNCRFENNVSVGSGGAIRVQDASPTMDHCVFDGNHAGTGGAIASGGTGGPLVVNCTFVANSADGLGGGLSASGGAPSVTNCIFAYGAGGGAIALDDTYGTELITCTDIYGNAGGDWTGPIADRLGVDGNMSEAPLFCDIEGGDYSLEGISPCLSYNNSCFALMGAYGLGCGFVCGDISGDELVNVADPVYMINYLFREGPAPPNPGSCDTNRNGELDVGDAVAVITFIFKGGAPLDCLIF